MVSFHFSFFFLRREGGRLIGLGFLIVVDVDILSTSSIHQGVSTVDFSLKIQPRKQ